MESDPIDDLIREALKHHPDIHKEFTPPEFGFDELRAVAEAAYKKGCEDTAKDVSDAELLAQMIRRGHIKISYDGIAEGEA